MKKTHHEKKIVTVLGAGNMGTAMAQVLALNGHEVRLWNWERDHEPLKQILKYRENKKYLKGFKLSERIIPTFDIAEALEGAHVVFIVIPSGVLEHTISFAARSIAHDAVIVDVSKGVDPESLRLIPHIIMKHVRPELRKNVVGISGPAVAIQMMKKQYTAMNIAGKNKKAIRRVQDVLANDYMKLVPSNDVIGVEMGGSFKNVYAIAMGICDGMGYGLNTKAALLTRALQELSEIIKAMGGKKQTAYGLAGLGDLVGTGLAQESRNRRFGECIGKGMSCAAARKKVGQTIEGISAALALRQLARQHHVGTPCADVVFACTQHRKDARELFQAFLQHLL